MHFLHALFFAAFSVVVLSVAVLLFAVWLAFIGKAITFILDFVEWEK